MRFLMVLSIALNTIQGVVFFPPPVYGGQDELKPAKLVTQVRPSRVRQSAPVESWVVIQFHWEQNKKKVENDVPVRVTVKWGDGTESQHEPVESGELIRHPYHEGDAYEVKVEFHYQTEDEKWKLADSKKVTINIGRALGQRDADDFQGHDSN